MVIIRRKIGKSGCDKVPKYLLDIYDKAKNENHYEFVYKKITYVISKTKFDSVILLSKFIQNNKNIEKKYISVIGPQDIIKEIKFESKDIESKDKGTYNNGKKYIAKYNYIIEYMGGIVQIKKMKIYG